MLWALDRPHFVIEPLINLIAHERLLSTGERISLRFELIVAYAIAKALLDKASLQRDCVSQLSRPRPQAEGQ